MDLDQQLRQQEAERWWQMERDTLLFSKDYGHATVQSLITINGGAIIAFLSFLAAIKSNSNFNSIIERDLVGNSLMFFGVGLLSAVLAGAMGYLNFQFVNASLPGPSNLTRYVSHGVVDGWAPRNFATRATSWIAIAAVVSSAVAFLCGSYVALLILRTVEN